MSLPDVKLSSSNSDESMQIPSVDALRPVRCPRCSVLAGSPGALRIHGHGRVSRWVAQGGPGDRTELHVRRYRCLACGHVMRVGSVGIISRYVYATTVIVCALWLWAVVGWSAIAVRRVLSEQHRFGSGSAKDWPSLRRWTRRRADLTGGRASCVGDKPKGMAVRGVAWMLRKVPPDEVARWSEWVHAQTRSPAF